MPSGLKVLWSCLLIYSWSKLELLFSSHLMCECVCVCTCECVCIYVSMYECTVSVGWERERVFFISFSSTSHGIQYFQESQPQKHSMSWCKSLEITSEVTLTERQTYIHLGGDFSN